jgi:hypothetical protein
MDLPTKNAEALRVLAHRQHLCGPRAIMEFLADLSRGKPFAETVADFSKIDPAVYAALAARILGGARGE